MNKIDDDNDDDNDDEATVMPMLMIFNEMTIRSLIIIDHLMVNKLTK